MHLHVVDLFFTVALPISCIYSLHDAQRIYVMTAWCLVLLFLDYIPQNFCWESSVSKYQRISMQTNWPEKRNWSRRIFLHYEIIAIRLHVAVLFTLVSSWPDSQSLNLSLLSLDCATLLSFSIDAEDWDFPEISDAVTFLKDSKIEN